MLHSTNNIDFSSADLLLICQVLKNAVKIDMFSPQQCIEDTQKLTIVHIHIELLACL